MINFKVDMIHIKPMNVGLIAKVCRVSKKAVLNWIYGECGHKKIKLKAFGTPGGHYRVWPSDLAAFLELHKMDIPFRWQDSRKLIVMCVDLGLTTLESVKDAAAVYNLNNVVFSATDIYDACFTLGEQKPKLIFVSEAFYLSDASAVTFFSSKCPVFLIADDLDSLKHNQSTLPHLFKGYATTEHAHIIQAIRDINKKTTQGV